MTLAIVQGLKVKQHALPQLPTSQPLTLHLSDTQSLSYIVFSTFLARPCSRHTHTHTHTHVCYGCARTHTHTHTRHTQNFPLNPDAPSELNNFQPTTMVKDRSTKQSLKWVSYYNLTYFVCSNFPLCVTIFKKHKRKMKNSFQINLRLPTKWKQKRPYTISHGINVYLSRP